MITEYEAKFIISDVPALRAQLLAGGAHCAQSELLMRRLIITTHSQDESWIRVRDEGTRVTVTLKKQLACAIDGMQEIEITVNDFDAMRELLTGAGLTIRSYQENRREIWKTSTCVLCIDTWPGLPPLLEIEGKTEEAVWSCASSLNKKKPEALFGSIDYIYESLLHIPREKINTCPKLTFETFDRLFS